MYKVYGTVASRAFRVMWMLEEIGEPYEVVPVGPQSEGIRAVNPAGKIPALADGDAILTDSTAIMTYLGDKHGRLCHKAGTVARARQDALTFSAIDDFDALLWAAARHARLPEEHRVAGLADSLKWEFGRFLDRFAERVEGPFLQGEEMTLADIVVTHCLGWAKVAGFPNDSEKMRDYLKRMTRREAYTRARTPADQS